MAVTKLDVRVIRDAWLHDFDAASSVNIGDAVVLNASGNVRRADKDARATADHVLGIVVAGAGAFETQTDFASGDVVTVCLSGIVSGFTGLTPNAEQYVDDNGELTETASTTSGDFNIAIGTAISADELLVSTRALDAAVVVS